MRLALIGDIHFYRLRAPLLSLAGKRLLGQCNLWLRRRHAFDMRLLEPALHRLRAIEPELVLFAGDFTTTALPGEFDDVSRVLHQHVRAWSERDVSPSGTETVDARLPALAVPGNHDRYTFTSTRRRSLEQALPGVVPASLPAVVQLTANWKLLLLDSAVPRLLSSRGQIDAATVEMVSRAASQTTADQGLVILCHYPLHRPPGSRANWSHELAGREALREALSHCAGKIVFLHGHVHQPWTVEHTHPGEPRILHINAGSPCQKSRDFPLGQGVCEIILPSHVTEKVRVTRHVPHANPDAGNTPIWHTIDEM
jgi:3',5'-cyclic AMP phosphodiesterase CpdA